MANVTAAGPPNLEHRFLRGAIEFAVAFADAGRKRKPPVPVPAAIQPFLSQSRLPTAVLGRLRRIIDADDGFRQRLAAAADELVDPIGREWLAREEGWEQRVATLVDEQREAAAERDAERELRRVEKRRRAAEEAAARARADVAGLQERIEELDRELEGHRLRRAAWSSELDQVRNDAAAARREARHARDRSDADRQRIAAIEAERDEALRRAERAERQRDELLAARAEVAGLQLPIDQLVDLRVIAKAARSVAERLGEITATVSTSREPVAIPGTVARDARRATEYVFSVPGILALIDGYNVAKLMWPDLPLADQRGKLLDAVDAVARRLGTELAVVFDGADVVGSHADRRRLARVRYSPTGVTADDVIRLEVAQLPPTRPVIVVTNDAAIRKDVSAAGANVVSSDAFAELALR